MTPHGPWTIVSTREVYRDQWVALRKDDVIRPDGLPGTHVVFYLKPGVSVLALDEDGNVCLTEEFHYGVGRTGLEVVSGGTEPGEDALETAKRELAEELGIVAEEWLPLGAVDPFTSVVVSPTQLFLARKLTFQQTNPEGTECIRLVKLPLEMAVEMVWDGRITHAPSCVALLKAQWLFAGGQSSPKSREAR